MRLIDDAEARRRIIAFATGLHSEVLPVDTVMMLLTQLQTVDAVPVVRCRDCKYFNRDFMYPGSGWCECTERGEYDNHFCSYGERKEGTTDG